MNCEWRKGYLKKNLRKKFKCMRLGLVSADNVGALIREGWSQVYCKFHLSERSEKSGQPSRANAHQYFQNMRSYKRCL